MQTTLYELCRKILAVDPITGKAIPKGAKPITQGLRPTKNLSLAVNQINFLTPEDILGLWIDILEIGPGEVEGYQRKLDPTKARRMGRAMTEGKIFPAVMLALDETDGRIWVVDGHHRGVGAVTANSILRADVHQMDEQMRRQVFGDQDLGTRIARQHHILSGNLPSEEYMQDAVTSDDNPWSFLVTTTNQSNKIPVTTLHDMTVMYVTKTGGIRGKGSSNLRDYITENWEEHYADELADLIKALGTKESNPIAFKAHALRGITRAATDIVREHGSKPQDIQRWHKVIGGIRWNDYGHLHKSNEFRRLVISHWNKRLQEGRRVPVPVD